MVDDGVDNDGSFAGLTVTDDQLALTATHRDQRVDGFNAGLHRLMDRAAWDNARCFGFGQAAFFGIDRTLAVDGVAEAVNNAAQQLFAHRHIDDGAGALDRIAFFDATVVAENHGADVVGFKVQGHALEAARKLDHLTGLDVIETVNAGDPVTNREHLAHFGGFGLGAEVGDLLLENCGNFRGTDIHYPTPFMASFRR